MARSTQAQKAQRLNAAYRLLARRMEMSEAATTLSHEEGISLRHAYRYLEEAAQLDEPVAVVEPTRPITVKISGNVIDALRAYAAAHNVTLSELVTRAIREFLRRARRRHA